MKNNKNNKQQQKQKRRNKKKVFKAIAREALIHQVGDFVGKSNAKLAYKAVASAIPKGRRSRQPRRGVVLSKMASMYGRAFATPFSESVKFVGIPRNPAQPSYKVTGFLRGTGAIGTTGFGYIAIAPTVCNDRPCVYYTTSSYARSITAAPPSDLTIAGSKGGGATFPAWAEMANLPYTSTQLNTSINVSNSQAEVGGRVVACAVRMEYTGTVLDRSGQFFAYADPQCMNVLGDNHTQANDGTGYTTTTLSTKDACEIINLQIKNSAELVVLPSDENMDDYPRASNSAVRKTYPYCSGSSYTVQTSDTGNGAATALIAVTGKAGSTFYFEVVTHVEYIGPAIPQGLLTENAADVVGFDTIKNVLVRAQRSVASQPNLTFRQAYNYELRKEGIVYGKGPRTHV